MRDLLYIEKKLFCMILQGSLIIVCYFKVTKKARSWNVGFLALE